VWTQSDIYRAEVDLKSVILFLITSLLHGSPVYAADAAEPAPQPEFKALDTQVQSLKQEVLELNRDLFVLEEELLFPATTQVAVFLSLDVGKFFQLDSVQVKIDDKIVANYLYTERELAALARGGVQRIYTGNLRLGKHELVAFFVGKGPHDRDYRRGTTVAFEKSGEPKFIELKIMDAEQRQQPEFSVKQWQ
jgi:hypothetical protein